MKTIKNKIVCGLLCLSAIICVGAGLSLQLKSSVRAATNNNVSVNTLGVLQWEEVDGATSYTVSSIYGELTTESNKANGQP